jgi:hypothetical protein
VTIEPVADELASPARALWASFVLGAWTLGSLAMFCIAAFNFTTIDRLLDASGSAPFDEHLTSLGRPALRDLLRYLSSELNRLYFLGWNVAQLGLGIAALWLCRGPRSLSRIRLGLWAMTLCALVLLVPLTPWITALGRSLDFVPREPPPPQLREFWTLHAAYTVLDLGKLILGVVLAVMLAKSSAADARVPPPVPQEDLIG